MRAEAARTVAQLIKEQPAERPVEDPHNTVEVLASEPASHPTHSSAFGSEGRRLVGRKYNVPTVRTKKRLPSIPVIHTWYGSCGLNRGGTDQMSAAPTEAIPMNRAKKSALDLLLMSNPP